MSTCHQAHNIPWGGLLEVLHKTPTRSIHYFERHNLYDVQDLVFTADEKGQAFNRLRHFARKFEAAILEFSQTERRKYSDEDIDNISEICGKEDCNEWLGEKLQHISGWEGIIKGENTWSYSSRGGDLDAMKELFIQGKGASLLCLARKGLPFEKYRFVTYSNFFHYGLGRIKEDCLTLYIHLNILLAMGTLQQPEKWHGQWHQFLNREILTEYDGNSHVRMYQQYFVQNPKFEDLEGLQELLKRLFRTLYLYDMIFRERGQPVRWETEDVLSCMGYFLEFGKANHENWWRPLDELRNKREEP